MSMRLILRASFAWACLIYAATPASADLLLNYEGGTTNGSDPGEAIQLGGTPGTTYTITSFNWYTGTGLNETAYAYGTLYIIDTSKITLPNGQTDPLSLGTMTSPGVYQGIDSGLTNTATSLGSSPGYLAKASASGNVYTFSPGVTLSAGDTYFFFTAGSTGGEDALGGTEANTGTATATVTRYRVPGSTTFGYPDFTSGVGINDFNLTGSINAAPHSIATPEPSTLVMLGCAGLTSLAFGLRSRNRKKAPV